ncbi:MAG: hypothetical protein AAF297_04110 [Planctomycetota bacterium]
MKNFKAISLIAIAAPLCVLITGCNITGPLYIAIAGPGNVDREFELDDDRSVVIFVDDPSNKVATRRLRLAIGEATQDQIIKKNLVDDGLVMDTRSALAATTRDREGEPLSIAEIGQSVGADQVIYVLVTDFNASPVSDQTRPFAGMRVKVIDSESADRLWPVEDQAGFALRVTLPTDPSAIGATSRSEVLRTQRQLADRTGLALAQLFYTVEIPQSVRR